MEGMRNEDDNLERLSCRTEELALTVESLAAQFGQETVRLKRKDKVARLNALRTAILNQAESARHSEMTAQSGHTDVRMVTSLIGLGSMLIARGIESKTLFAISRHLLDRPGGVECSFGTVLIRIGPEGLPEGVDVVCISRLARESHRDESEVIAELRRDGHLLFRETSFSSLIDKAAEEILKGELDLPVPAQSLPRITLTLHAQNQKQLGTTGTSWVAVRRQDYNA